MTELEQLKVDIFILESKVKMEKSFSLAIMSLLGPEDERLARRLELMEKVVEAGEKIHSRGDCDCRLCDSINELDAFNKETRG